MANEKRLIDANRFLRETRFQEGVYPHKTLKMELDAQPTVDAVEVVHGRWIEFGSHDSVEKCSECGTVFHYPTVYKFNYCPNCGAKMDGGNEDG